MTKSTHFTIDQIFNLPCETWPLLKQEQVLSIYKTLLVTENVTYMHIIKYNNAMLKIKDHYEAYELTNKLLKQTSFDTNFPVKVSMITNEFQSFMTETRKVKGTAAEWKKLQSLEYKALENRTKYLKLSPKNSEEYKAILRKLPLKTYLIDMKREVQELLNAKEKISELSLKNAGTNIEDFNFCQLGSAADFVWQALSEEFKTKFFIFRNYIDILNATMNQYFKEEVVSSVTMVYQAANKEIKKYDMAGVMKMSVLDEKIEQLSEKIIAQKMELKQKTADVQAKKLENRWIAEHLATLNAEIAMRQQKTKQLTGKIKLLEAKQESAWLTLSLASSDDSMSDEEKSFVDYYTSSESDAEMIFGSPEAETDVKEMITKTNLAGEGSLGYTDIYALD